MQHTENSQSSRLLRFAHNDECSSSNDERLSCGILSRNEEHPHKVVIARSGSDAAIQRNLCKGLHFVLVIITFMFCSVTLKAQNSPDMVVQLIDRVAKIEDENRELRGQLEEARHDMDLLKQRLETFSSDVEYRLGGAQSAAAPQTAPTPVAPGAAPVPPVVAPQPQAMQAPQGAPIPLGHQGAAQAPQNVAPPVAAAPPAQGISNSTDAYEQARAYLEQGEYDAAERAFTAFLSSFPKDGNAGAAQYWLGVTHFVRGQYDKAAAVFAKGYKTYPKSPKAPDNLLKLARSLAALNRTADACMTLSQLSSEYPKALTGEVVKEKKNLGCK